MAATFKLNREELTFILNYLPAYKDVPEADKDIYTRIFGMLAAAPRAVVQSFTLPVDKNAAMKVPCIKAIRMITGWGLKEAKDAFDAGTIFKLKDLKMGKEGVETNLAACSFGTPIVVDWLMS